MIKFFNTMTGKKQVFRPLQAGKVKMYTCGPTVYDYCHIGNLRAFLFDDLLKRVLKFNGFKVRHVMNLTDVGHLVSDADAGEDKIEVGAQREHKTAWDIAKFYINAFKEDAKTLRIQEPDLQPRATGHIKDMIELIKIMEEKGYTYVTEDGIYFNTARLKNYGRLARLKAKGLKAGARVEMRGKKNPTDFALWKFSPHKRDMQWDSPWGVGFPGWHIECSAMVIKYLGETIDIHCGGVDHIPVHHTNEIAQSEVATGKKFVNYWLHNEHLLVDNKKMSKSLGNYYTLADILKKGCDPVAFRYLCLSAHYRTQLNFTFKALDAASKTTANINSFMKKLKDCAANSKITKQNEEIIFAASECRSAFTKAMEDDLNTPLALKAMFEMMNIVNRCVDSDEADAASLGEARKVMDEINSMFDFYVAEEPLHEDDLALVKERERARKEKDYEKADHIRAVLKKKGILLEDTPYGVVWRRKM